MSLQYLSELIGRYIYITESYHWPCSVCDKAEGPFLISDNSGEEYTAHVLCLPCIQQLFAEYKLTTWQHIEVTHNAHNTD